MDDNFASGCHVSNLTLLHSFQMLLLGLLMCCGSAVIHTLKPTTIVCSLSRVAAGASYTVVYSTFLVKLVFLVSLNGGVYLPGQLRKRKKNQEKKRIISIKYNKDTVWKWWKFHDFSITEILREINFLENLELLKLPFFAIFGTLNFVYLINFTL